MIKSFHCKQTEKIFNMDNSTNFPEEILQRAYKKLRMLHNSQTLNDLRVPSSNYLEKLSGDRRNQFSIRINNQWRVCFEWKNGGAYEVEIVDYH